MKRHAKHGWRREARRWLRRQRRRPCGVPVMGATWPAPFTPRAKEALERAFRVSLKVGSPTVDAQHLAIAVLAKSDGMVPLLLSELGVNRERLHDRLQDRAG